MFTIDKQGKELFNQIFIISLSVSYSSYSSNISDLIYESRYMPGNDGIPQKNKPEIGTVTMEEVAEWIS